MQRCKLLHREVVLRDSYVVFINTTDHADTDAVVVLTRRMCSRYI